MTATFPAPPDVPVMSSLKRCLPTKSRALDWQLATIIIAVGSALGLPGETLAVSKMGATLLARANETQWSAFLIFIGLARIAALIINGRWRDGSPVIRSGAAAFGAVIWSQFAVASLDVSLRGGVSNLALPVWLSLLGGDLFCMARSAVDARRAHRVRGHADRSG